MNKSIVKISKFSELDGLEIKEATFLNKKFPKHFHNEWSLGRIDLGCENMKIRNNDISLFCNATILISPYSVHSNWGNKDEFWKYQSIYINEDIVKYIAKKSQLDYCKLLAQPYYLTYDLPKINTQNLYLEIYHILSKIFEKKNQNITNLSKINNEIIIFLNENFQEKITLSDLEKQFKTNKYKLLRCFKNDFGLSPLEYVNALRMESAKKMLFSNEQIVNVALENGYYDQSHFVHTFKKYVGITPIQYKSNCNILQV